MKSLRKDAKIRASNYNILAECYYQPEVGMYSRLKDFTGVGETCSQLITTLNKKDEIELLQIDYARLFIGPYKLLAPPYGSFYLDNRVLMGDSTVHVMNIYREEELDIKLMECPDHIKVELEFMYYLIQKEIEAVQNSDVDSIDCYRFKQRNFLENHLNKWIASFCELVKTYANTRFYKMLAQNTRSFIEQDMALFLDS